MASLEKKMQNVDKMVGKIKSRKDDAASKSNPQTFFWRRMVFLYIFFLGAIYTIRSTLLFKLELNSPTVYERAFLATPCHTPRLTEQLKKMKDCMDKSFGTLSGYVTELKLDHQDGKLQSDRLKKSLDSFVIPNHMFCTGSFIILFCACWAFTSKQTNVGYCLAGIANIRFFLMAATCDDAYDEDEQWLQELLDYNRQAHKLFKSIFCVYTCTL